MDNYIKIICEKCGSEDMIGKRVPYNRARKGIPNYCTSCMISYKRSKISTSNKETYQSRPSIAKGISDRAKERYAAKSLGDRENIIKRLKEYREKYWRSISDEDKNTIHERAAGTNKITWQNPAKRANLSLKIIKYWESLSIEEREARSIKNSVAQKRNWTTMDDNLKHSKIIQLNEGSKKYFEHLSDEELEEISKKRSFIMTDYWANLSKDEKDRRAKETSSWMKKHWNSMTLQERDEASKIVYANLRCHLEGMTDEEKKERFFQTAKETELIFQDTLNTLKFCNQILDYRFQWFNNIKHPDFDRLFPRNLISGGLINPRHPWDFKIDLKDKSILVDIDGSIHDEIQHKGSKNLHSKNYRLIDLIKFRDSQRPYQTDGLDAYVVQCYDDKLTENTPVLSFQTGETLTYRQFIALITFAVYKKKI